MRLVVQRSWLLSAVNNSDGLWTNEACSSVHTVCISHLEMVLLRGLIRQSNELLLKELFHEGHVLVQHHTLGCFVYLFCAANLLHLYRIHIKGIGAVPPPSQVTSTWLKVGDAVWVKNPHRWCTTKFVKGCVTGIASLHLVDVDATPWHVGDVFPQFSSLPLADDGGNPVLESNN